MAKDRATGLAGVVLERLPNALYRVELDGRRQVLAHAARGADRNFIRILAGDRVLVDLSPTDVTRGRITRRMQDGGRS